MRLGALILAASMVASAATAAAQTVDWAAGQSGGGWFTMSAGLGKLMEERGVGVTVKVIAGGATANPDKIQQGQAQFALGVDILAKAAREGTLLYKDKPHDKIMMVGQSFSDSYLHFIRAKGAPLSLEQIFTAKEVHIGVPKAGTSDELTFRLMQEYYGTNDEKMKARGAVIFQGDYNELASAFKKGQIDYVFVILGIPGAMVQDMQQSREAEVQPVPDQLRQLFAEKYGFSVGAIPKTAYPKYQTRDVPSLIMATTLLVGATVSDDIVYRVIKTICDNVNVLPRIHPSMDVFDCKTAIKTQPVPVHSGALKFYKEKGFAS